RVPIVLCLAPGPAGPCDVYAGPVWAHRYRVSVVVAPMPVVALHPPLIATGGVVRNGRVVRIKLVAAVAVSRDEDRRSIGADGDGQSDVRHAFGAVVALHPDLSPGGRFVG